MDIIFQAIEDAGPIWQQSIFRLSGWHGLLTLGYGVSAWLCFLNVRLAKESLSSCAVWWAATVLMCLLGANVVLQADVLVTQTLRALASLQGWYEQRRALQLLAISLIALALLSFFSWSILRSVPHTTPGSGRVSAGLAALLMLLVVRTVSAHGTDAVINARMAGLSVGRLFEIAGIGGVMWGALRSLCHSMPHCRPHLKGDGHV